MPENESFKYEIKIEISQKILISLILYLFYNVDITDLCKKKNHLTSIYIDDVNILIKEFTI